MARQVSADPELIEILYTALNESVGLVIQTNSAEKLRQRLYAARRDMDDESLSALTFTLSPNDPNGELWIIKKE